MGSKSRKNEVEDNLNHKIRDFITKDVFIVLKKDTKASEKEAELLIDDFVKKME